MLKKSLRVLEMVFVLEMQYMYQSYTKFFTGTLCTYAVEKVKATIYIIKSLI